MFYGGGVFLVRPCRNANRQLLVLFDFQRMPITLADLGFDPEITGIRDFGHDFALLESRRFDGGEFHDLSRPGGVDDKLGDSAVLAVFVLCIGVRPKQRRQFFLADFQPLLFRV